METFITWKDIFGYKKNKTISNFKNTYVYLIPRVLITTLKNYKYLGNGIQVPKSKFLKKLLKFLINPLYIENFTVCCIGIPSQGIKITDNTNKYEMYIINELDVREISLQFWDDDICISEWLMDYKEFDLYILNKYHKQCNIFENITNIEYYCISNDMFLKFQNCFFELVNYSNSESILIKSAMKL